MSFVSEDRRRESIAKIKQDRDDLISFRKRMEIIAAENNRPSEDGSTEEK